MTVKNSAGRIIETEIAGKTLKPFAGAKKYSYSSKVTDLKDALKKCGIKDGATISFHHQLRNGDYVINTTLAAARDLGIKDIRMAQTAMFNVCEPVIDFIKEGVVNRIEGSINGVVGDYISKNPLPFPVVLRSHGGRWSAVKRGELHPDIAIIAASSADERGNATGIIGDSAFGPISSDMGFDWHLGKAFFLLGRVAGLTAQVYEEQTEQKPMRKMFTIEAEYEGPAERDLP